jgi:simple sugar transport system ATP-binding protein
VEGNGQDELAEAIAGTGPTSAGTVQLSGEDVTGWSAQRRFLAGMAYIPEDRQHKGLIQDFAVSENGVLKRQRQEPFLHRGLLRPGAMRDFARGLIGGFDIRPDDPDAQSATLSGGNQQKLVLARELSGDPRVIVAAQPTRGVDVAAIQAIHERLVKERTAGKAILLISQDLDEIKSLSDRILVMSGGEVIGELTSEEATDERLGLLMAGERISA